MSEPRYSFSPLERRGVLLGLHAGQLAAIGAAAVMALVIHATLDGPLGVLLSVGVLAAGVVAAIWTRNGQPLSSWAVVAVIWLRRRGRRPQLSPAPLIGHATEGADPSARQARTRRRCRSAELPDGVQIVEHRSDPYGDAYGVVRDRAAGCLAAVVPVNGRSLSLLDPTEQAQCLDAWRTVLAALARPGSPVSRLQWVQRSSLGDTGGEAPLPEIIPGVPSRASSSYGQLLNTIGPVVRRHDTGLVLVVGGDRSARAPARTEALERELRFLHGQLRQVGLEPGPPLDHVRLLQQARTGGMAVDERWSTLRVDGDWHATYWVAEWPRLEVGPGFLQPLLVAGNRTAVSVLMAPVPADRALREVRSARTADLADATLRSRAGFLASARREREAEGVTRREGELADGHIEYRFSGYVTVTAEDEEALAVACAGIEHTAHAARLELRRLFGRQAEAFTWTRPLGRGLR